MAKFVRLESGTYINVDNIITISGNLAYTMGFDNDWQAHRERVTKTDIDKVKATITDLVESAILNEKN